MSDLYEEASKAMESEESWMDQDQFEKVSGPDLKEAFEEAARRKRAEAESAQVERLAARIDHPMMEAPSRDHEDAQAARIASRVARELRALGPNPSLGATDREMEERLRRGIRADLVKSQGEIRALRMRVETLERALWGLIGKEPAPEDETEGSKGKEV